jgi:hypothetical protein
MNYRGWKLSYSASRPVTGTWVAASFGVELSASSEDAIKRMVDQRIKDYPLDGHGRRTTK